MQINRLILGDYATNCYIVQGDDPKHCVIVDPADNGPAVQRALEDLGTVPEAVLLTHGHYDHILATPHLQKLWPDLPVYCHPLDCPKELTEVDMGVTYPTVSAFSNLRHYTGGQEFTFAGLSVKVIETPGHTPGSVTLQCGDVLFTGDTLFQGDIGRTDFAGGDERAMMDSLALLAGLPGDYQVLPGHDEVSTLEAERKSNPYLKAARRRQTPETI